MVERGIQFLVDAKGEKSAVVIDLRRYRDLWEDMYDVMVTRSRRTDPRLSWNEVCRKSDKTVRKRA